MGFPENISEARTLANGYLMAVSDHEEFIPQPLQAGEQIDITALDPDSAYYQRFLEELETDLGSREHPFYRQWMDEVDAPVRYFRGEGDRDGNPGNIPYDPDLNAGYGSITRRDNASVNLQMGVIFFQRWAEAGATTLTVTTEVSGDAVIPPNAETPFSTELQVFIDDSANPSTGATVDPAAGITIPYSEVPAGPHTVTIRRTDGSVFGTATFTTTSAPMMNEELEAPPPSEPESSGIPAWIWPVGATAMGVVGYFLGRRGRRNVTPPPATGSNPPPPAEPVRVETDPLDAALDEVERSTNEEVTADTVVNEGEVQVRVPQEAVVRAEILVLYPELRHPDYARQVDRLVRTATSTFAGLDQAQQLEQLQIERTARGHTIAGGVPEQWLRRFAGESLTRMSEALDWTSERMGLVEDTARRNAEDATRYREEMRQAMRGETLPLPGR